MYFRRAVCCDGLIDALTSHSCHGPNSSGLPFISIERLSQFL